MGNAKEYSFLTTIADMNNNGAECVRRGSLYEANQGLTNALMKSQIFLASLPQDETHVKDEIRNESAVPRRSNLFESISDRNPITFKELQEFFFSEKLQLFLSEDSSKMVIEEPIFITNTLIKDDLAGDNQDIIFTTSVAIILFNMSLVHYKRETSIEYSCNNGISKRIAADPLPKYVKSKALLEKAAELLFRRDANLGRQRSLAPINLFRNLVLMAVFNNLIQMADRHHDKAMNNYLQCLHETSHMLMTATYSEDCSTQITESVEHLRLAIMTNALFHSLFEMENHASAA